jgi:hypothetical protein
MELEITTLCIQKRAERLHIFKKDDLYFIQGFETCQKIFGYNFVRSSQGKVHTDIIYVVISVLHRNSYYNFLPDS